MFEAVTAGQIADQRRRQQPAVLVGVDAAVGEAPLVAQSNYLELDVLVDVAAVDEMHRQRTGRQVAFQGATAGHKRLGHQLTPERAWRILTRVGAGESVGVDTGEVEKRQQFGEVAAGH
ncbi:hypothetical protein MKOR_09280 [Mycolicibacillus koreensis]|nr:hypothetical protein MKOR_09280 [Mycolicibacillus koreensis]